MVPPPPRGQARIAGGLLGVAGGESWRGARGGFEQEGPVTRALRDLCHGYAERGGVPPVEVARRHEGVPGPGWLLPVAIVHRRERPLVSDTLELAIAAGVPRSALSACVSYVELASALLAGRPVADAVQAVTGTNLSPPTAEPPLLCGIAPVDGLTAGIWALGQPGKLYDLVASLASYTEPWVAAAAAGLLGLRDGCSRIPAQWHRGVPGSGECLRLAQLLARSTGYAPPAPPGPAGASCAAGGASSPGTASGVGMEPRLVVLS